MIKLTEYKLSDLYKMDSGIGTSKEQAGHGAPFISFSDIFNNTILPEKLTQKMDTTSEEQEKYSVKKGDILLTRTSETIDELAMSSVAIKDYPNATFSGFAKRLRPIQNNITYDKYMAFLLRSKYFRDIINAKTIMTLRASFNEDIFNDIKILLPDYNIQVKVGDFLFDIEKQIENNKKFSLELESLAKTIYEYWFLQFDFPTEEGTPYKSSGGKMVWNEKLNREIPNGWNVEQLINIANLYQPQTLSDKDLIDNGKYMVYGAGGVFGKYNEFNHNEREVIISCRGNCGQVRMTIPKSWINGNSMVVHPFLDYRIQEYIYYSLKIIGVEKCITGSVQRQITRTNLENYYILIPNRKIVDKFENIMELIRIKIENIFYENEKLESLKNFIIPLLMNGQVTFRD